MYLSRTLRYGTIGSVFNFLELVCPNNYCQNSKLTSTHSHVQQFRVFLINLVSQVSQTHVVLLPSEWHTQMRDRSWSILLRSTAWEHYGFPVSNNKNRQRSVDQTKRSGMSVETFWPCQGPNKGFHVRLPVRVHVGPLWSEWCKCHHLPMSLRVHTDPNADVHMQLIFCEHTDCTHSKHQCLVPHSCPVQNTVVKPVAAPAPWLS